MALRLRSGKPLCFTMSSELDKFHALDQPRKPFHPDTYKYAHPKLHLPGKNKAQLRMVWLVHLKLMKLIPASLSA